MTTRKPKHPPRPRRARTLLAVTGGAMLAASLASGASGCGPRQVGNPFFPPPDMAAPQDLAPPHDIGNFIRVD